MCTHSPTEWRYILQITHIMYRAFLLYYRSMSDDVESQKPTCYTLLKLLVLLLLSLYYYIRTAGRHRMTREQRT